MVQLLTERTEENNLTSKSDVNLLFSEQKNSW